MFPPSPPWPLQVRRRPPLDDVVAVGRLVRRGGEGGCGVAVFLHINFLIHNRNCTQLSVSDTRHDRTSTTHDATPHDIQLGTRSDGPALRWTRARAQGQALPRPIQQLPTSPAPAPAPPAAPPACHLLPLTQDSPAPARPPAAAPPLPVPHRHVCAPARARVSACVPPPPHALGISGSLMKVALTMLPLN